MAEEAVKIKDNPNKYKIVINFHPETKEMINVEFDAIGIGAAKNFKELLEQTLQFVEEKLNTPKGEGMLSGLIEKAQNTPPKELYDEFVKGKNKLKITV